MCKTVQRIIEICKIYEMKSRLFFSGLLNVLNTCIGYEIQRITISEINFLTFNIKKVQ